MDELCPCYFLFSLSPSSTNHLPPLQLTKHSFFNPSSTAPIFTSHCIPANLTLTGRALPLFSSGSGSLPTSFSSFLSPTFPFLPLLTTLAQVWDFCTSSLSATYDKLLLLNTVLNVCPVSLDVTGSGCRYLNQAVIIIEWITVHRITQCQLELSSHPSRYRLDARRTIVYEPSSSLCV
ncbi:hypothetical protein L873DRAFT_1478231 [Choiromyces venosus 120613-1]|uniref:Uncharacterized protein n=1 Tax=Choiromyces venosus 120613-1 TaxID=1336337 RepID=A0A3N4JK04_9PEZI|nr:hypothetical protein L873DRAFT_1478231 [Choiromyces venosus 120613-1]